jgi:hypothetical protein
VAVGASPAGALGAVGQGQFQLERGLRRAGDREHLEVDLARRGGLRLGRLGLVRLRRRRGLAGIVAPGGRAARIVLRRLFGLRRIQLAVVAGRRIVDLAGKHGALQPVDDEDDAVARLRGDPRLDLRLGNGAGLLLAGARIRHAQLSLAAR